MPDIIKKIWSSFKEKPDIWFFYLFLATSTLTVRKVLYFLPINNSFNEYTGVYIYLSDIFLFLTFLFYVLCNINSILSILKSLYTNILAMFHVEHYHPKINITTAAHSFNVPRGTLSLIKKTYALFVNHYFIIFPLATVFFSFLSILWTTNTDIALFRSVKLLEYVLLYFYILENVPRGTFSNFTTTFSNMLNKMFHVEQYKNQNKSSESNCSTWNNDSFLQIVPRGTILIIILIGVIQSIIGISQFIVQHSIGLFLLKESFISPSMPGVAKVILNGYAYIRAYGLFPHPNIFGGYLVFSIIVTLLIMKLFHVEQFNDKPICHPELVSGSKVDIEILKQVQNDINKNCSTWNNLANKLKSIVPRGTILHLIIFIQCIALFLTFSKSAIFGLLIGLFYILYVSKNTNVPRLSADKAGGTFYKRIQATFKMFHACLSGRQVEHFRRKIILITLIFLSLLILLKPNINSLFIKSLQERNLYLNVSRGTFLERPLLGIGAGQFVLNMSTNYELENWQYQPVHNVFLLILNEFGVFLFIGLIYFLFKLFHVEQFKQEEAAQSVLITHLRGILLSFIFIMFFDHYLWDIQQGSILLWILFALLASQAKNMHELR